MPGGNINADDVAMAYLRVMNDNQIKREDELVIMNNFYYIVEPDDVSITHGKFATYEILQGSYESWQIQMAKQYDLDIDRLGNIQNVQGFLLNEYNKKSQISMSPIIVRSALVAFTPSLLNGGIPSINNGYEIFDSTILSVFIPFIQYNGDVKFVEDPLNPDEIIGLFPKYYKVFKGDSLTEDPNYNNTVINSSRAKLPNTIYLTLWIGNSTDVEFNDMYTAPRESFVRVEYHLDTNYLTIDLPFEGDASVMAEMSRSKIQSAFPTLNIGKGTEAKVRGGFDLYGLINQETIQGLTIDETSLLDLILSEPLFNIYLYVEENIKPYAFKKRLDVHYRSIFKDEKEGETPTSDVYISNSAAVSITLTQRYYQEDSTTDVIPAISNYNMIKARVNKGTPFIHINISRADSRKIIDEFVLIFRLLLGYYLDNWQPIFQDYLSFVPELAVLPSLITNKQLIKEEKQKTKKKTVSKKEDVSRIKALKAKAPDLFVDKYARKCQGDLKPIVISNEEIPFWKAKTFLSDGVPTQRQVMTFPLPTRDPQNPNRIIEGWNFVCPNDNIPYPGLKTNTLANKDKYPYIPCCFIRDQTVEGLRKGYNEYFRGYPPRAKKGARGEGLIKTSKFLEPGIRGFVSSEIESILKNYDSDSGSIIRYGVIRSPNSLIHCVCVAVSNNDYLKLPTDLERETYVTKLRRYIANNIRTELLLQEFYDKTPVEIKRYLDDNSFFLDPNLFYRALEEIFNINIFCFSPPDLVRGHPLPFIDIPRNKLFHIRPLRPNRPTVLIYNHWGSESNMLEYPQCELIIDFEQDKDDIRLFGANMTELCHSILLESFKTITWRIAKFLLPNSTTEIEDVIGNVNIYSLIDYMALLNYTAKSQYIDEYGKLRALNFTVSIKNGNDTLREDMTLIIPPSQPENLPIMEPVNCSFEAAVSIFGQPSGITRLSSDERLVNGIWFSIMDLNFGVYVPVKPITLPSGLQYPIGPPNSLRKEGSNVISRLTKLRKILDIIIQLVRWLYDIDRNYRNSTPSQFINEYFSYNDKPITDSVNYYDLIRIKRILPIVTTPAEGITILSKEAPTLFSNGRIVFYSKDFYDKIGASIKVYYNETVGLPNEPARFIDNYHSSEESFKQQANVAIFVNEKDLLSWMVNQENRLLKFYLIKDKLDNSSMVTLEPFIYRDVDGKIYLIQNVIGGELSRAFTAAVDWYNRKFNSGSQSKQFEGTPAYMVYAVNDSGIIVPFQDKTGGNDLYVKILRYGVSDLDNGRYAAILDLI